MSGSSFASRNGCAWPNYWLVAQAAMGAMALLRLLPMDAALDFADRAARRSARCSAATASRSTICARPSRKRARTRSAPSPSTCGATWRGLPPNMSILDRLFDYRPGSIRRRAASRSYGVQLYEQIATEKTGRTSSSPAHLGNFELMPIAGETYGLQVTALFRPPNNPYIADYILSTRAPAMGDLHAVAARRVVRACPHSRSRRQYRRAGRPEVPARRPDDLLRPAVRDQPAAAQARPAISTATSIRRVASACPATASGSGWRRS